MLTYSGSGFGCRVSGALAVNELQLLQLEMDPSLYSGKYQEKVQIKTLNNKCASFIDKRCPVQSHSRLLHSTSQTGNAFAKLLTSNSSQNLQPDFADRTHLSFMRTFCTTTRVKRAFSGGKKLFSCSSILANGNQALLLHAEKLILQCPIFIPFEP